MKAIANSMVLEVTFERTRIRDGGVPSHGQMVGILDCIDENIERSRPLYLHCWGGGCWTGLRYRTA
jgi:protein-tyrosine phosphatase